MQREEIKVWMRGFLEAYLGKEFNAEGFNEEAHLIDDVGLDSLGLMEICTSAQLQFQIEIDVEKLFESFLVGHFIEQVLE